MQQQQQQQQQQQPPPPPRSRRDRIVSAFKARIKPLQSHRLLDERERILALSQMPLKWKKRKKTTRAKKSTGEEGEENAEVEDESVDERVGGTRSVDGTRRPIDDDDDDDEYHEHD